MILAGFPITIESEGISKLTNALGAISTFDPMVILPTITTPAPIHTSLPIIGHPFFEPLFVLPIVTL